LLDVPDAFFTVTFSALGILLGVSRRFARVRMEERAWEQRLEEGRRRRLARDPSLTEAELRRREAAAEWSAYGRPRVEEEEAERRRRIGGNDDDRRRRGRRRVRVLAADRDGTDEREREGEDEEEDLVREHGMTEEEIAAFEREYGIQYDPYYDDPYTEGELPEGKFDVDRLYGDRVYDTGEIFYRDERTGLYFRQGSKPRNLSFFG
jgi:hypothetical protein